MRRPELLNANALRAENVFKANEGDFLPSEEVLFCHKRQNPNMIGGA